MALSQSAGSRPADELHIESLQQSFLVSFPEAAAFRKSNLTDISENLILFFLLQRYISPRGFALNRCLLQTLKAADEMGGVCYLERGDNQHAQPSLVSALPHCRI